MPFRRTLTPLATFKKRAHGKRVLILYPRAKSRNLFLTSLLQQPDLAVIYHRVPHNFASVTDWFERLYDELIAQYPDAGTRTAGTMKSGEPLEEQIAAFIADINEIDSTRIALYLDEVDRIAVDSDFHRFFITLVNSLPDHMQLVVCSRMLTTYPWTDFIASGDCAVFGIDDRISDLMFMEADRQRIQIEVQALGQGFVWVNGRLLEQWDGALPRYLFFYFMDNQMVQRAQIFTAFWPDMEKDDATNVFHVTKRKITEAICRCVDDVENCELTRYLSGYYRPNPDIIRHYDVNEFEDYLDRAANTDTIEERDRYLKLAVHLHRAPYLAGIDLPWVVERRRKLMSRHVDALTTLARSATAQGDYSAAIGWYARVLRYEKHREDIHRDLMRVYLHHGEPEAALEQYHRLSNYLTETVGLAPSADTLVLRDRILEQLA